MRNNNGPCIGPCTTSDVTADTDDVTPATNMNTNLSKSIDYQTTKIPLQSLLDKKEQK